MKAIVFLLLSMLTTSVLQAQDFIVNNKIKYVSHAPDGSVAFIISDDANTNLLKLDASQSFYKYEVLDLKTAEAIYSEDNNGKSCVIDKSFLGNGNYRLKIYNKNFIITSKITVRGFPLENQLLKHESLALNVKD